MSCEHFPFLHKIWKLGTASLSGRNSYSGIKFTSIGTYCISRNTCIGVAIDLLSGGNDKLVQSLFVPLSQHVQQLKPPSLFPEPTIFFRTGSSTQHPQLLGCRPPQQLGLRRSFPKSNLVRKPTSNARSDQNQHAGHKNSIISH